MVGKVKTKKRLRGSSVGGNQQGAGGEKKHANHESPLKSADPVLDESDKVEVRIE